MKLPEFSVSDLFESGVHFGHRNSRRNPKMSEFIYGEHNGTDIINLDKTMEQLKTALSVIYEVSKKNGKILFVGTKKQAQEPIAEYAKRCGQSYINVRWLGGTLTNWFTVSKSIKTLVNTEKTITQQEELAETQESTEESDILKKSVTRLTKKEVLELTRKHNTLQMYFGGIRDMSGMPDLLFVLDTNKEKIAIQEAKIMKIPIVAIVDTNSNLSDIDYPIAGNDDATRAIDLYSRLVSDTVLFGMQKSLQDAGIDIGNLDEINAEYLAKIKSELTANKQQEKQQRQSKKPAAGGGKGGNAEAKGGFKPGQNRDNKPKPAGAKQADKPAAKKEEATPMVTPVAEAPAGE